MNDVIERIDQGSQASKIEEPMHTETYHYSFKQTIKTKIEDEAIEDFKTGEGGKSQH